MLTFDEINKMTDEEVAAMNKKLQKQVVKRIAITVGVSIALHFGANLLIKKLDKNSEED